MANVMRWSEERLAAHKAKRAAELSAEQDRALKVFAEVNAHDSVKLLLPWPPSTNHMYRNGSVNGARYLTNDAKKYREEVERRCEGQGGITGRLSVTLTLHPPDRRTRDLDNTLKSTLDALQRAGVYANDGAIDTLMVKRSPDLVTGGMVHVEIRKI